MLQVHGAVSTALALHRLGRDDLADRFAAWASANENITELLEKFTTLLQVAGLPTDHIESEDKLEALIAEVFAVADDLGIKPQPLS